MCDTRWWHRFVCAICSVQSSSLRRVRYPGSANKISSRLKHCAAVWDTDLCFFLFFFPLTCPDGGVGRCWIWLAKIYTRESALSSRVLVPSLSPSMSCFSVCQLPAASWYCWHPCWRADQTHTRTQFPVVLRNCWPSFQGWLPFPVQLLVPEGALVHGAGKVCVWT